MAHKLKKEELDRRREAREAAKKAAKTTDLTARVAALEILAGVANGG